MEAIIVKQDEGQAGFVRYTILVTLRGQSWSIIRRFNDFIPLHNALCRSFPGFPGRLPVKKWFGRFNPDFLQDRKLQLQHYLDVVTRLPGFPESSHEGCLFFEIDGHMDGQGMDDLAQQDGGEIEDTTPSGEASISAILDDTSHAFINTSSPLHQAFIEQMDPVELAQQRNKLLQWTSGFRGPSSTVKKLSCAGHLQRQQQQQKQQPPPPPPPAAPQRQRQQPQQPQQRLPQPSPPPLPQRQQQEEEQQQLSRKSQEQHQLQSPHPPPPQQPQSQSQQQQQSQEQHQLQPPHPPPLPPAQQQEKQQEEQHRLPPPLSPPPQKQQQSQEEEEEEEEDYDDDEKESPPSSSSLLPQQEQERQRHHSGCGGGGGSGGRRGGGGAIDTLAARSSVTVRARAHLLAKHASQVMEDLREARHVQTSDGKALVCRVQEDEISA
ncbi:hypothetical protein VYU27_001934 [Nannochloropsis oceanica]